MQMADFEALKVYDGVADYHLNRFRIAFECPSGATKEGMARDFVSNFPSYLKSPVASVEFKPEVTFEGKPTLKFWGSLKLLGLVEANFGVHHDWVVQAWVDPRVGFTAQTLKRGFVDVVDDAAAAAGGSVAGGVLGPVEEIAGAITAVEVNRYHFLAGRRSWRLESAAAFGQDAGDFEAGDSSDILILETVAVERFSLSVFRVGDWVLSFEDRIPAVWIALLENFARMKVLRVRRFVTLKPGGLWNTTKLGWVRYLAPTFSNLSALQADTQYRDMLPLYPTILPPPS